MREQVMWTAADSIKQSVWLCSRAFHAKDRAIWPMSSWHPDDMKGDRIQQSTREGAAGICIYLL
jgi:hypothetical protein